MGGFRPTFTCTSTKHLLKPANIYKFFRLGWKVLTDLNFHLIDSLLSELSVDQ